MASFDFDRLDIEESSHKCNNIRTRRLEAEFRQFSKRFWHAGCNVKMFF